jgi:CIC family chloride channel protein
MLVVALGKIVTTSLTIGSGGSGGVFGPSMVIGGCLGAFVGGAFHRLDPSLVPNIGPFTIVGMAGFFAGAANTPISTMIMVSDMCGNYTLLLPSMLVVAIAYFLAKPWTIYSEQVPTRLQSEAHRGEYVVDVLDGLRVESVLRADKPLRTIRKNTPLPELVRLLSQSSQSYFPIVDDAGRLEGIVSVDDIRTKIPGTGAAAPILAEQLAKKPEVTLSGSDSLHVAVNAMTLAGVDEIPVVGDGDPARFLGSLTRHDVIVAYSRRMIQLRHGADGQPRRDS